MFVVVTIVHNTVLLKSSVRRDFSILYDNGPTMASDGLSHFGDLEPFLPR